MKATVEGSEPPSDETFKVGKTRGPYYRYVVIGVLVLTYIINFLDRQLLSILAEPIRKELGLSDTQLGMVSGLAFALFYSTFALPIAWIADRSNRVRIIAISCAAWSICSAACGLAGNFAQLALARMGVGIAEAGGSPPPIRSSPTIFHRPSEGVHNHYMS